MGRVKILAVKRLGEELLTAHPDKLSGDFESNKKALKEIQPIESKHMRNVIAGYITHRSQVQKKKAARASQAPVE